MQESIGTMAAVMISALWIKKTFLNSSSTAGTKIKQFLHHKEMLTLFLKQASFSHNNTR